MAGSWRITRHLVLCRARQVGTAVAGGRVATNSPPGKPHPISQSRMDTAVDGYLQRTHLFWLPSSRNM